MKLTLKLGQNGIKNEDELPVSKDDEDAAEILSYSLKISAEKNTD